MHDVKIIRVIPKCTCGKHSDYIVVNKTTGETKYCCGVCSTLTLFKLKDNGWDVIHIG